MSEESVVSRGEELRGLAIRLHRFAKNERLVLVQVEREYPEGKVSFEVSLGAPTPDRVHIQHYLEANDERRHGSWRSVYNGPADWLREGT